ncbi:hypothetical protein QR685DRAFT_569236 [Neurospora intermedia]|uniref:SNF5-domain-containing protein n=1 Tax=Neurospora intermedia TaxID=5142 RepID=A0ABR3DLG5_NEUIN
MAASLSSASAMASGSAGAEAGASSADASSSINASGTPAASASQAPSAASKAGSPQDGATPPVIQRDKDSLNRVLVDRFVTRDMIHAAALKDSQKALNQDMSNRLARVDQYKAMTSRDSRNRVPPAQLYGQGYNGYGNGVTETGGPVKIIYPSQKPRPGKRTTPPLKFSRKDLKKQAEQHEELVPIRIDVDWDKVKLRDTFTFNLHERLIPVEVFASQLVEDMGLKPPMDKHVHEQVVTQMVEQLQDFYPFVHSEEDALDPELPYSAYKNDDMRILIKLNITIREHTLVDQFEWDINNPMNSPEEFAARMADELSLSGEFTTAIAHCIREQTQLFTRSLYSVGHPFDGRPIEDPDLTAAFLPTPIPYTLRPNQQQKDYAPYLYENTEAELERTETMFSREQRRQKRSVNRRGGPQLPDLKERQRTIRTAIVSSVIPGGVLDIEDSRLFKKTTGPVATTGGPGRGRRIIRDGDLSDSEDSMDSAPDSPAMSVPQGGTARTRGMRGAATAAAQRMANIGRSETPETIVHHHETRMSRRFGREATREETEEPLQQQHIVTLRVHPTKLRRIIQGRDSRTKPPAPAPSGSGTPGNQRASSIALPGSMGPPPTTPAAGSQHNLTIKVATPPTSGAGAAAGGDDAIVGAVPALSSPANGEALPPSEIPSQFTPGQGSFVPPISEWLNKRLEVQHKYPYDSYDCIMRHNAVVMTWDGGSGGDVVVKIVPRKTSSRTSAQRLVHMATKNSMSQP